MNLGVREDMSRKPVEAQPSMDDLFDRMASVENVDIRESEPQAEAAPEAEPVAKVKANPNQSIRWEDWSISVKASPEDKAELARALVARMVKSGAKQDFELRYDCVLFAFLTREGIVLYDCTAKRRAVIK